jgi:hypothetical protein
MGQFSHRPSKQFKWLCKRCGRYRDRHSHGLCGNCYRWEWWKKTKYVRRRYRGDRLNYMERALREGGWDPQLMVSFQALKELLTKT